LRWIKGFLWDLNANDWKNSLEAVLVTRHQVCVNSTQVMKSHRIFSIFKSAAQSLQNESTTFPKPANLIMDAGLNLENIWG